MPIYEYRCPSCGHEMEKLVSRTDVPPPDCPDCAKKGNAIEMRKLVSVSSFSLKGGGWADEGYSK